MSMKRKIPSEAEKAYVAGFFDGEGFYDLQENPGVPRISVAISQDEIEPLLWVKERFGGNVVATTQVSPKGVRHHRWNLCKTEDVLWFLNQISPYTLRRKRKESITIAMCTAISETKKNGKKPLTNEQILARMVLASMFKEERDMSMKPRMQDSPKQIPGVVSGPTQVTEVGSTGLGGACVTQPKVEQCHPIPGTVSQGYGGGE